MKNRIDELVKAGMKDRKKFNQKLTELQNEIEIDPTKKRTLQKDFKNSLEKKGKEIERLKVKIQIEEISEMVNLSYIAKMYFNKTRHWFYQRINENVVDGKVRKFTDAEIEKLNAAFKDMSEKIGSISVS